LSAWRSGDAALASGFVHNDGSGDGDVEGGDGAEHRNADEEVAVAAGEFVEAFAFAAEDEADVGGEVAGVIILSAAFVEAEDPDVVLLEGLEGAIEVGNAGDADMLAGSGGGAGDGGVERGAAAVGQQDAVDSGSIGGAEERAEVVRVFNAVEGEQKQGLAGSGRGEQIFEGERGARADDGDGALMLIRLGEAGEGFARLSADGDFMSAGQLGEGLESRVGRAASMTLGAFAGDSDIFHGTAAGAQSFFDGVEAVEHIHRTSLEDWGESWRNGAVSQA
jgi:hypothetical protein